MLLLSLSPMMNVVMWGHEKICVDFQINEKTDLCFSTHHSLECKSALIGMISPELCDFGICKFDKWLLYIGLARIFDLTLNLAALMIAGLDYGRYLYIRQLQVLRDVGNNRFFSTLGYTKLGLNIVSIVICIVMAYLTSQFGPVAAELVDMGCLRHMKFTAFMGKNTTGFIYVQIPPLLIIILQDLAYRCWKAYGGQRYMRIPTSIEPARSFSHTTGLPTSIEPAATFIRRRVDIHFLQLFVYVMFAFWALIASGSHLRYWGKNIQSARDLAEGATTQGVGDGEDWCFYCPGEKKPIDQLGAHVVVQYIGWFLVILNSVVLSSLLVLWLWIMVCCCC